MIKANFFASLLAIAATLGTAHAAQVMGANCPIENNGTFGETASHQDVICANGKWQDAKTLPVATVHVAKYSATKALDASYGATQIIGVRSIRQNSDGHGQFTLVTTVVGFNSDNTAHVVVDLDDAGWKKHIYANVSLDKPTPIATGNDGEEYRVTVERMRS